MNYLAGFLAVGVLAETTNSRIISSITLEYGTSPQARLNSLSSSLSRYTDTGPLGTSSPRSFASVFLASIAIEARIHREIDMFHVTQNVMD